MKKVHSLQNVAQRTEQLDTAGLARQSPAEAVMHCPFG